MTICPGTWGRGVWLCACIVLVTAAAQLCAADAPRVRVLTYNIHHGEGMDGKVDLERIAAVIKRVEPDVVALQEVDVKTTRSQGVDQAAELGRLTGMHVAFGKAMDYAEGQYGEAILSRWPLEEVQTHDLPFEEGCEPRCAVAARVRGPDDKPRFVFAGTHLEHQNATVRLCQAGKLAPKLANTDSLPVVLAGDFNAEPGSPPMTVLRRHWTDATDGKWQPTCPAEQPRVTLDYVLYRPTDSWRVIETRVVEEAMASDHRPVLVVLELP
jgi:endonuclease/exonuclease/phosphatase family metal-dependent hydrolase